MRSFVAAVGLLLALSALCQAQFTDINANIPGLRVSSLAWGDYDGDGRLDLAAAGRRTSTGWDTPWTMIIHNDGNGAFHDIGAGVTNVDRCSIAWGDYDNDGDLDLGAAGMTDSVNSATEIFNNNGSGSFTTVSSLYPYYDCCAAWIDCNNDGRLEFALTGFPASTYTRAYRYDGSAQFTDIEPQLQGFVDSRFDWGDYDNDGDLDVAITGISCGGSTYTTEIYRNDGDGVFTEIAAGVPDVLYGDVAWGDYDNDGDPDLAVAGTGSTGPATKIYRNTGGVFSEMPTSIIGVSTSSLEWGDYDNDGDLDLALTGYDGAKRVSKVYRNDGGGVFTDSGADLHGAFGGTLIWGDYDGDGRLDLALSGEDDARACVFYVYHNSTTVTPNTPPTAPTGLTSSRSGNTVVISWNAAADAETPSAGLTYNIRIGTTPGGSDVCSGMAALDGHRRLPKPGMAKACKWKLNLPPGTYYWRVQAIDTAFAGSPWSTESQIVVPDNPVSPIQAKSAADDTLVSVNGCVVTAVFGDDFYVERPDRSSGIRVHRLAHQQSIGNLVDTAGTVATDSNGERYIEAWRATCVGPGSIAPLGVINRDLGGQSVGLQAGVPGGAGLNNIGLLVKTAGMYHIIGSSSFTIDDGSGTPVKCVVPSGVKINYSWGLVAAAGISTLEKVGDSVQRVVKVRSQSDLQAFSGSPGTVSGTVYDTGSGVSSASTNVESPHPYPNNYTNTWQISAPAAAQRVRVHFSTLSLSYIDYLDVMSSAGSIVQTFRPGSSSLFPFWSLWVTGNSCKLRLMTDGASQANGFVVDSYEYELYIPLAGVQLTLTPGNYTFVTGAGGAFSLSVPPGTYTLTPSLQDSTFSPTSRSVTVDYGQVVTANTFIRQ